MSLDPSKVAILKEKLTAALAAQSAAKAEAESFDLVSLTNFTQVGTVSYVGGINVKWNEKDHPRDPHTGEFVETPNGYIWGKAKSASFALAGAGGKTTNVQLDLKPGDVAFKTPAGNVVISHPDNSYSMHTKGGVKQIPGGGSNVLVTQLAQEGKLQKIAENPALELDTHDIEEASKKLAEPESFDEAKAPKQPGTPGGDTVHLLSEGVPGKSGKEFLSEVKNHAQSKLGSEMKVSEQQAAEQAKKTTDAKNVENENKTVADLALGAHEVPDDFDQNSVPMASIKNAGFGTGDVLGMVVGGKKDANGWVIKPQVQVGVLYQKDGNWRFNVPGVKDWNMGKGNGSFYMAKIGETEDYPKDGEGEQPKHVTVANTDGNIMAMFMGAKAPQPKKSVPVQEPKKKASISSLDLLKKSSAAEATKNSQMQADPEEKPKIGDKIVVDQEGHPANGKTLTVVAWLDTNKLQGVDTESKPTNGVYDSYLWNSAGGKWFTSVKGIGVEAFQQKSSADDAKPAESSTQAEKPKAPNGILDKGDFLPNQTKPPSFKPGKNTYTAKQIAQYQDDNKGVVLGTDGSGKKILSGSWVDVEGKPVLLHASPYGGVTGYRWVSTKQQASNLPKEDLLSVNDFPDVKVIEDPTGKPYAGPDGNSSASVPEDKPKAAVALKHGNIMSAAVVGSIPNTAVKHKLYVEEAAGGAIQTNNGLLEDANGKVLKSGDWVDIDGKPFQVHASPNEGNVAMAKWVSTKKQKSNNTYDFPGESIMHSGLVKIDDPTGTDYKPVEKKTAEPPAVTEPVAETPKSSLSAPVLAALKDPDKGQVISLDSSGLKWTYDGTKFVSVAGISYSDSQQLQDLLEEFPGNSYSVSKVMPEPEDTAPLADWEAALLSQPEVADDPEPVPISPETKPETYFDSYFAMVSDPDELLGDVTHVINAAKASNYPEHKEGAIAALKKGHKEGLVTDEQMAEAGLSAKKPKMTEATQWKVTSKNGVAATYTKIDNKPEGDWLWDGPSGAQTLSFDTFTDDFFDSENFVSWEPLNDKAWGADAPETPDGEVEASPEAPMKNAFVHPVSGVVFELEDGDTVYKHTATDNGWIVKKASGDKPIIFFNQYGKQYKPKESQKNLDTAYEVVTTWPGKKDSVPAEPVAVAPKDGDPLTLDHLAHPKIGDKIKYKPSSSTYTVTYTKDGWVFDPETHAGENFAGQEMNTTPNLAKLQEEYGSTFHPAPAQENADLPLTKADLASAQTGDKITYKAGSGKWITATFGKSGWTVGGVILSSALLDAFITEPDKYQPTFSAKTPGVPLTQAHLDIAQNGDKISYTPSFGPVQTVEYEDGMWVVTSSFGPKTALTNTVMQKFIAQPDTYHAKFLPKVSHLTEVTPMTTKAPEALTPDQVAQYVKQATPGDSVSLSSPLGSQWVFTKKANGSWAQVKVEGPSTGALTNEATTDSVADNVLLANKPGWGVQWLGQGAAEDSPQTPFKEAVGVKEPAPVKKAPSAKKAKAAAEADLPTSYTFPNSKQIDLKQGEMLVQITDGNGIAQYVHVTNNGKKYDNSTYDAEGMYAGNWQSSASWSPAKAKKEAKENENVVIIASKPVLKVEKTDYSTYEKEELNGYYGVTSYIDSLSYPVPTSYYGSIYPYNNVAGFEKPWNSLSQDEKLQAIHSYRDIAGKAYASIDGADLSETDKSNKASITKAKNAFDLIHRIAVLAEEIRDPDSNMSLEDMGTELEFFEQKAQQPGMALGAFLKTSFPLSDFTSTLRKAYTQRQFKASISGLGFDIDTASTEELDTYAKANGFHLLAALPEDYQKTWVLNHLGDPTLDYHTKNALTTEIEKTKIKVGVAEVLANFKKDSATPTYVIPENKVKGAPQKAAMKKTYEWSSDTGTVTVTNIGNDEWSMKTVSGTGTTSESIVPLNDASVQQLVNATLFNGSNGFKASDEPAYGGGGEDAAATLAKKYSSGEAEAISEMLPEQVKKAFLTEVYGASLLDGYVSQAFRRKMLYFHAAGDMLGQYHLAKAYVGDTIPSYFVDHPADPNVPKGKYTHYAFKTWVESQSWGPSYIANGAIPTAHYTDFNQWVTDTYGPGLGDSSWLSGHPHTALHVVPDSSILTSPDGKVLAPKPAHVSEEAWALATNVSSSEEIHPLINNGVIENHSEADLDAILMQNTYAKKAGLIGPMLGGVPVYLKQLAVWASTLTSDGSEEMRSSVLDAIAAKVKAGEFLDEATPVWIAPNGTKFPISPGAKVYTYNDQHFYIMGPDGPDGSSTPGYSVEASSNYQPQVMSTYTMSSVKNDAESYKHIFTMPNPVTLMQAKKDNPDLSEEIWNTVEQIEAGDVQVNAAHGVGPVLTAYLKNHPKIQDWENLYAQHKTLPEHIRNLVANALDAYSSGSTGQKALLDLLNYKAQKGHFASMQSKGLYDPSAPWLPNLSLGQTTEEQISSKWPFATQKAYVQAFGLTDEGEIPAHLDGLLNPPETYIAKRLPAWSELELTPTGKSLGGMHTKKHWVDQDGNEWMTKAFNSDPNAKARVDAEIAGIKIGALYGFRVPEAEQLNLVPGQSDYAYLQYLKPGPGDFTSKGVGDLTTKQLQQAMEEHLLDWLISNHDSHSGNLRFDNAGNVFGIDKGQAFKHFPNDKLAVGYLPPENGAAVWYDQFYNALKSGSITKAQADEVTKHVLRKAQQISKDKDEEFRAHLEYAFKNRTFWPDQYPSKQQFIDALVERKHNAFDDFVDFYKKLYKSSPHTFDIDTENLIPPKLDDHTHISVSQDYADDVKKAGLHGKAMMFASADLEDSHILMSTALDSDGKTVLTGEAKIRKDGDTVLSNWLKKQTIEGHTISHQAQSFYSPEPEEDDEGDPSWMPQNAQWFQWLVNGSKTVSSHNKNGDQQYNAGTLENMEHVHKQMQATYVDLAQWEENNPDKPYEGTIPSNGHLNKVVVELLTMEQHASFKQMLETYEDYYSKVIAAKGTTEKISPHFTQHIYTPSKKALADYEASKQADAAEQVEITTPDGVAIWGKQADGKWHLASTTAGVADLASAPSVDDAQILKWKSDPKNTWKPVTKGLPDPATAPVGTVMVYTGLDGEQEKYVKISAAKWQVTDSSGGTVGLLNKTVAAQIASTPDSFSLPEGSADLPSAEDDIENSVQVGTKLVKVKYKKASAPDGEIDFATGELKLKKGESTNFHTGHMYEIDFGNTVIEYRPWEDSANVALAQKGLMRFHVKDWNGNAESIDEIFDLLRQMGLNLDPADEESLELFYWKHQEGLLKNRKGGDTGKWKALHDDLNAAFAANKSMTNAEQLQAYRDAWGKAIGKEKVASADWMPHFSRLRPHGTKDTENFTSGRPWWYRSDYSAKEMRKYTKNFPVSSLSNNNDALLIALSGAALSTEERARFYGSVAKSGMSSGTDQSYGSSAVVYMRQNLASTSDYSVVYHPRVLKRTHTYTFGGDMYGQLSAQKENSPYDYEKQLAFNGGSNEAMVKNSVSVLDDVVMLKFGSESQRAQAIKQYKEWGITEINGFPIEEVFVTYMEASKVKSMQDKIWEAMEAAEEAAKQS